MALRTAQFGDTHLLTAEDRVGRGRALAALGRTDEGRPEVETALAHLNAGVHADSETARLATAALREMAP